MRRRGFTIIEMLVVLGIIGILVTVSAFGLAGARESARDKRRISDLELIKSGLELYRADCNQYPASITYGSTLTGANIAGTLCTNSNTYIQIVPNDPQSPTQRYFYSRPTITSYFLCARLENAPSPAMDVTGCGNNCGSGAMATCNYKITGI